MTPTLHLPAGGKKFSGPMAAAADILKTDGLMGFFKGWVANFARLGPQTIITFIVNGELCHRLTVFVPLAIPYIVPPFSLNL